MALNLEKQLLFYGSYHHDPTNVAIHMVFVPILLATGLMFASNTPALVPVPAALQVPLLPADLGTLAGLTYGTLYVLMEPVAGTALFPLIMGSVALGHWLLEAYGTATANYAALGVHVFAWLAQFVGHGHFEGRAPALLDNLVQALFLAPLFVWLEFLFALGYRPELKARLDKGVQKELKRLEAEKKNKKAANGKAK